MSVLFDEQLSESLLRQLHDLCPIAVHVRPLLAGFVAALGALVAIGFEGDPGRSLPDSLRRSRRSRSETIRNASTVASRAALGAVDLVHTIALSNRSALGSAGKSRSFVKTSRPSGSSFRQRSVVLPRLPKSRSDDPPRSPSSLRGSSPVAHGQSPLGRPSTPAHPSATVGRSSSDCAHPNQGRQRVVRRCRLLSGRDRSCRQRGITTARDSHPMHGRSPRRFIGNRDHRRVLVASLDQHTDRLFRHDAACLSSISPSLSTTADCQRC